MARRSSIMKPASNAPLTRPVPVTVHQHTHFINEGDLPPAMSYGTGGNEPKANREAEGGKSLQVRQHRKGDDCCSHGSDEGACHEAFGTGVSLIDSRREQDGRN